jgi:hypothetical protein
MNPATKAYLSADVLAREGAAEHIAKSSFERRGGTHEAGSRRQRAV